MAGILKVAIEGPGADSALEDLLGIPDIHGHIEPVQEEEATRDGGVLLAIGAIVGIASGVATLVDKIIAWRERWNKSAETKRLSIVIEDAKGNRLALDSATPEQIAAALSTFNS